jgi:hypothetical protein
MCRIRKYFYASFLVGKRETVVTRRLVWRRRQCNGAGLTRSSEIRANLCITRGMIGTMYRGSRGSQGEVLEHKYTGVDPLVCSIYTPATCGHWWWWLLVSSSPTGRIDKMGSNTLAEMVTLLVVPSSYLLTTKLIILSVWIRKTN